MNPDPSWLLSLCPEAFTPFGTSASRKLQGRVRNNLETAVRVLESGHGLPRATGLFGPYGPLSVITIILVGGGGVFFEQIFDGLATAHGRLVSSQQHTLLLGLLISATHLLLFSPLTFSVGTTLCVCVPPARQSPRVSGRFVPPTNATVVASPCGSRGPFSLAFLAASSATPGV